MTAARMGISFDREELCRSVLMLEDRRFRSVMNLIA